MQASDLLGILRQNLLDAGFDGQSADICMNCAAGGEWHKLELLLARQKGLLLERVHTAQKQIDCLDFLVFNINKKHKQEE